MSRVFSNLLSNAIYHSPRGGQIDVTIYSNDRRCIVQVADRGKGIAPADLPLLFDRFYQVDGAVSRQYGGTGLGLSICKAYVELLGGQIWLNSKPDKGTLFKFTIPYCKRES